MNETLKFFFPIEVISAVGSASESYLHSALAIVVVKSGATPNVVVKCTSKAEVQALTDDAKVLPFFDGGGTTLYVLPVADLDDAESIVDAGGEWFSILFGDTFLPADIIAFDSGSFTGCKFAAFALSADAAEYATLSSKKCGWYGDLRNLAYELGRFLNPNRTSWSDDQAATLPQTGNVETSAEAVTLFDAGVSFALKDTQYGNRLGFFCIGKETSYAPYVIEEMKLRLQSRWMQFLTLNQPRNSITAAKQAETDLQANVLDPYVIDDIVQKAQIKVDLNADGEFTRDALIEVNKPRAWWRMLGKLKVEN